MRFAFATIAAAAAALVCGCRPQADAEVRTETPTRHNGFDPVLVDLHDQHVRPFEDPGVKVMVLVFVLQDCPIANSYMPELNRLAEKFASRSVQIVVIESDPQITPQQARDHAEQYKIEPPVVIDADHQWVKLAGARKTPEVVVFSHGGEVLYRGRIDDRYAGLGKRREQVTTHDLEDALEAILTDRPVPQPITEAVGCYIPELSPAGK